MNAIHLIQKDSKLTPTPVDGSTGLYKSGFWKVSPQKAESLLGGKIYFHEKRATPSFFGGTIVDFYIQESDPWKDRIVFRFQPDRTCKGVKSGSDGWSMEKKYVSDK